MIEITNERINNFEPAIRGMRNPMNSWGKSDSKYNGHGDFMVLGPEDYRLARKLALGGSDHGKFLRMITVTADIDSALYWWKQYDTYKVATVTNSCSTMHKIAEKEFTLDDFSIEHLTASSINILKMIIDELNLQRILYLRSNDKRNWWQMIQLLPSSYNQKRTVLMNYENIRNMYHARKNHKLDEWREFCRWVEELPYSEFITEKRNNNS